MQCPCLKDFCGIQPLQHSWLRGHLYVLLPGWCRTQSCSLHNCDNDAVYSCAMQKKKRKLAILFIGNVNYHHTVWCSRRELSCCWVTLFIQLWPAASGCLHSNYTQTTAFTLKVSHHQSLISQHTKAKPGGNFHKAAFALMWCNAHSYWAK